MSSEANGDRPHTPMTCPTCGRSFLLHQSPTPPFCSERCQLIDLGRWLDESIGLPHEGDPGDSPVEFRGDATDPPHDTEPLHDDDDEPRSDHDKPG